MNSGTMVIGVGLGRAGTQEDPGQDTTLTPQPGTTTTKSATAVVDPRRRISSS